MIKKLSTLFYLLLFSTALFGQDPLSGPKFLKVREAFQPSVTVTDDQLIVDWKLAPNYYLYQERFNFKADGQKFDAPIFEPGIMKDDEYLEKVTEVYYDQTRVVLPNYDFSGEIRIISQGCADAGLCYAPTSYWFKVDAKAKTAVAIDGPSANTSSTTAATGGGQTRPDANAGENTTFLGAIFGAFLGGLILNLMPCVFPVLAIKALKISQGGMSAAERIKDSIGYTAGTVFTCLVIIGTLLALRAAGSEIGWGFQLQNPWIITALIYLFFIVGLSFSGWLLIGAGMSGMGQGLLGDGKKFQSFFTGMLAMVVASPCSAPFMAVSMSYAMGQSTPVALLVFAFLGFGMAFPLVLVNNVPAISRNLPRPGPWMETLKEVLAFPMYAAAVWLFSVLLGLVGSGGILIGYGIVTLTAMFWGFKRSASKVAKGFAVIMLVVTGFLIWTGNNQVIIEKKDFTTVAALEDITGGKNPVFLDVTAEWCITCKANEAGVLYTKGIQDLIEEKEVIYMVADWTNENPEITRLLEKYNRVGIPLYLYWPAGSSEAQILPQLLTKGIVRDALNGN